MSSDQTADALRAIVERSRTSGRPGSDHDLAEVLGEALDRYALARLYLVAHRRVGQAHDAEVRADLIARGLLR